MSTACGMRGSCAALIPAHKPCIAKPTWPRLSGKGQCSRLDPPRGPPLSLHCLGLCQWPLVGRGRRSSISSSRLQPTSPCTSAGSRPRTTVRCSLPTRWTDVTSAPSSRARHSSSPRVSALSRAPSTPPGSPPLPWPQASHSAVTCDIRGGGRSWPRLVSRDGLEASPFPWAVTTLPCLLALCVWVGAAGQLTWGRRGGLLQLLGRCQTGKPAWTQAPHHRAGRGCGGRQPGWTGAPGQAG